MEKIQHYLTGCLYFNTSALSRHLTKIAQSSFKGIDVSPPHASLMLIVYDNPGINPKELSELLNLSPSTVTRFVDALVKKRYLFRKTHGKSSFIHPTEKGLELKKEIASAWKNLYQSYVKILGQNDSNALSYMIQQANEKL